MDAHFSFARLLALPTTLVALPFFVLIFYLARVNQILKSTPPQFQALAGPPWSRELLTRTYKELEESPIDYAESLPPKLDRRYIVTGGAGLVGGYLVLQLLARGTPPDRIRILDIRKTERNDMLLGSASRVEFIQTDIASTDSVHTAFHKPWDSSIAKLPLTVFHTAAVIIPSARSILQYEFPEAINVRGTQNVLDAARQVGADIFSSTSSASIAIRPIEPFMAPWASEVPNFAQVLDEGDFYKPLRKHDDFFGNYPASKAAAERLVCEANEESFRTGCIRPGNGVYGNPTDNTVGGPLSRSIMPTWIPHIVQSFVHGANVAVAHLDHEAALAKKHCSQSGRPFAVTDPNPPITYRDLYNTIKVLSLHPFHVVVLPPVLVLLISHVIEWYNLLPFRYPFLRRIIPAIKSDAKYVQPGLFSICTHLVVSDAEAKKPVEDGGLGYKGVLTTLQGMVLEVLEWNREHAKEKRVAPRKPYTTSVDLAEKIQQLGAGGMKA